MLVRRSAARGALPAVGATMQERVFPQLLSTGRLNAHPSMIETSRLCVDAACPSEAGEGALYDVTFGILQCTGWRYRALATDHDQLNGKSGGYTTERRSARRRPDHQTTPFLRMKFP